MILTDTDVLIDYLAGVGEVVKRMEGYLAQDGVTTTAINCFELLSGAGEARRGEPARRLAALLPVLPLDRESAVRAAAVRRELESSGQGIGMGDSLIAGIALTHGIALWTRNRRHFERVKGLVMVGGE